MTEPFATIQKGLGRSSEEVRRQFGISGEGVPKAVPLTAQQGAEIQRRSERIDDEVPISREGLLVRLGLNEPTPFGGSRRHR